MDYLEFETQVKQAEELANKNINRYRFKLRLFSYLGYAVIISMIVAVVGLVGGLTSLAYFSPAVLIFLVKKKLIFVLIPMLWIMVRSLWVKIEAPVGYPVTRNRFPAVFEELDALSKELDSLKIHKVLLMPEMNAAVVQAPKLGLLGWQKNTLFLGLELILSLTPDQVRAVVAHELGHLSGNHSRFSGHIYRVRESWAKLMNGLMAQDNIGARLMGKFFGWYAPRFSAFSFPLARMNEYEADAMAATLTSPEAIGDALINVNVVAPYLEEHYWQNYFSKADIEEKPKVLPWEGLNRFLAENKDPRLQERLAQAMEVTTDISDTHPALQDRLAALNVPAHLPQASDKSAAKEWLGDQYDLVIKEFDQEWYEFNKERWKERYDYVQESHQTLAELRTANMPDLSDEDLQNLSQLEGEFGERKDAIIAIKHFRERNPEDLNATYQLACFLMAEKSDECLALFEKALSSAELAYSACANAYQYLVDEGRGEEAERWRSRAEQASDILQEAEAERDQLYPKDSLEKVDMEHETVQAVIAKLKQSKKIKKAWIAKKVVKHYPEIPAIAIAVVAKGVVLSEDSLYKTLAEEFSEFSLWVIPKSGDFRPLAKKIIAAGERVI